MNENDFLKFKENSRKNPSLSLFSFSYCHLPFLSFLANIIQKNRQLLLFN
jgi:hypothetical protein